MYCIYGAEVDVFINFMLSAFLSNGYNIPFVFYLKAIISKWADVTVELWVASRTTVTMWVKVSKRFCSVPYLNKNISFYKVTFYLHSCTVVYLYWPKHKVRGVQVMEIGGVLFHSPI